MRAQEAQEQPARVLANLYQCRATGGAIAAGRFVNGGQTLQLRRQRTPCRCGAWCLGRWRGTVGLCGLQRRLYRGDVFSHRLVEQPALHRIHALGLGRKLHPTQPLQLIGQLADQRFAFTQRALVCSNRRIALAHHAAQRVDIGNSLKCARIHEAILAI